MPFPKPQSRAADRRAKKRKAAKVVKSVRQQCVDRDGYCRVYDLVNHRFGDCHGRSEWAHLGESRRFKTRGQDPEVRHTTVGSLMLCTRHHQDYDQGRITIVGDDADGALGFFKSRDPHE